MANGRQEEINSTATLLWFLPGKKAELYPNNRNSFERCIVFRGVFLIIKRNNLPCLIIELTAHSLETRKKVCRDFITFILSQKHTLKVCVFWLKINVIKYLNTFFLVSRLCAVSLMIKRSKLMRLMIRKSRIRETKHLSTDADSSTDAIWGWTKNTPKPDFFEKRKKSSKAQKLKNV